MKRRSESHAWVKCGRHFNFDTKNSVGWQAGKRGLRANRRTLLLLALRPGLSRRDREDLGGKSLIATEKGVKQSINHRRKISPRVLAPAAVASLALGLSFVMTNTSTSAASITLTIPSAPLSVEVGSDSNLKTSSPAQVSVQTDSLAGYTLTVNSNSDDNKLKGQSNELTSIPKNLSEDEFSRGEYVNNWGFKPDKLNGENNSSYIPGPTSESLAVIDTTKGRTIDPNVYNFAIAARADTSTQNGVYSNTFTLCVTSNANTYNFTYDLDDGNGGPSPNPQTGEIEGDSATLSSEVPTKEKDGTSLEFKGWCTELPTGNDTDNPTCAGGVYQPGSKYPLCDGGTNITQHSHFV